MEDGASLLFAPDFLTPSQWRDAHTNHDDPVKNLLMAVLEQALRDLTGVGKVSHRRRKYKSTASQRERAAMKQSGRASALRRDACAWIFGDAVDTPFAFMTICEALDVDAKAIRREIFKSRETVRLIRRRAA